MKNLTLTALLSLSLLAPGFAHADSFKRIRKEADFTAHLVNKNLTFQGGSAVIRSNGKTDGKLTKKGKYHGVWKWQNGYYCRNLVIDNKQTGTDCQKVEISGNTAKFTREKGKGRVTVLKIN